MITTSILTVIIIINMTTILLSTPLRLGLLLFLVALTIRLIIAYTTSPFLAVIIFLIYVGGVIITFAYFIATTPKSRIVQDSYPVKTLLLLTLGLTPTLYPSFAPLNKILYSTITPKILFPFQTPQILLILIIILALFLAIIIIVKIATLGATPLRPFK